MCLRQQQKRLNFLSQSNFIFLQEDVISYSCVILIKHNGTRRYQDPLLVQAGECMDGVQPLRKRLGSTGEGKTRHKLATCS